MESIKPKLRKDYDTIGIFAVSSPDAVEFPERYTRAITNCKKVFKNVVTTEVTTSKKEFVTASKEKRIEQLTSYMQNKKIDLLMSLTGGYNTNSILEDLDYTMMKEQAKPIVGYSDTTALQLALYCKSGMVSFYGPSLLSNFGEFPDIKEYTLKNLKEILEYREGTYEYEVPIIQTKEMLFWDKEDKKEMRYKSFKGWKTVGNQVTEGILVGGNLNTLLALIGTPYCPDFDQKILFLEDTYTTPSKLVRDLTTLKHLGVWNKINGLIVGSFFCPNLNRIELQELDKIIEELGSEIHKPVMFDVNIGHTSPIITLPIGIHARMEMNIPKIILLESAILMN